MEKILLPSLVIILSFAVMSLLASFGGQSSTTRNDPSTRMTTGTKSHVLRRYYDHSHSTHL